MERGLIYCTTLRHVSMTRYTLREYCYSEEACVKNTLLPLYMTKAIEVIKGDTGKARRQNVVCLKVKRFASL